MTDTLMILPAREPSRMGLLRLPTDLESQEAYRQVTGLIASIEEGNPDDRWADISALLEDHGFETLEFILGPALD